VLPEGEKNNVPKINTIHVEPESKTQTVFHSVVEQYGSLSSQLENLATKSKEEIATPLELIFHLEQILDSPLHLITKNITIDIFKVMLHELREHCDNVMKSKQENQE
jgi:hypothetical protein